MDLNSHLNFNYLELSASNFENTSNKIANNELGPLVVRNHNDI